MTGSLSDNGAASRGIKVATFGCRLNLVEGEAMRHALLAAGQRDMTVVNTCGVTGEAARQGRQAVRREARHHPERRIVVTGCAAEMEPERFAAMPEVDAIVPNAVKTNIASWREDNASTAVGSPLAEGTEDHTRAFLAVQNGCDHACTFCAIPMGRGASRSAPFAEIVTAARSLAERGFGELVLTGVDLTSYGTDLPNRPNLGRLVRAILAGAPNLPRLRLSSVDCIELDADLLAAFAEEERLMPYLHLSLQSGDDLILKRMKRRHSRRDAVEGCHRLRSLRPDIAFGADLIAGFPTETAAMAARSEAIIEDCGLSFLHVFPFSPRPGTAAARMPPLTPALVRERAARLRETGARALRAHLRGRIGRTLPVLAERGGIGRAPDFTPISVGATPPGTIHPFTIAGHDGRKLFGKPLHGL